MKLYKFFWDCGRQGEVTGLFVADPERVNKHIGKEVYFGEILGKHSEVYGVLEEGDLEVLNVPDDVVKTLFDAIGDETIAGYNPITTIEDQEADEE